MADEDRVPCERNRLLIADDEHAIRRVFQQIVSYGLPGCRIDLAVNGSEAVDSFRSVHHGVILMDLKMPVMDGETAFHKIREICDSENWEVPSVVFCTGFNPSSDLQEIVANSRKHYLIRKPVANETLLEVLKARLGLDARGE